MRSLFPSSPSFLLPSLLPPPSSPLLFPPSSSLPSPLPPRLSPSPLPSLPSSLLSLPLLSPFSPSPLPLSPLPLVPPSSLRTRVSLAVLPPPRCACRCVARPPRPATLVPARSSLGPAALDQLARRASHRPLRTRHPALPLSSSSSLALSPASFSTPLLARAA